MSVLENWIDRRQMNGSYTFLRKQAIAENNLSPESVKKALQRLKQKGRIAKVKDYFYVIVPLEYAHAKAPPVSWFINDLMDAVQAPYYVGLLTAAAQYGAAHHAPQEFHVITTRTMRPLEVGRSKLKFFSSKFTELSATNDLKTPTGKMRVSTVETTIVDLVRFAKSVGHLDNVATVVSELADQVDANKLLGAINIIEDIASTQRIGYILNQVGANQIANEVRTWLDRKNTSYVPLRSGIRAANPIRDLDWHLLVDRPLEIDG